METTRGDTATEPAAAPHLSHLLGGLGRSVPVHVWSVEQQVDQRSTLRSQRHARLRRIAKVNERDVEGGCAFSLRGDGQLVQSEIHEKSLDENTTLKGTCSSFL